MNDFYIAAVLATISVLFFGFAALLADKPVGFKRFVALGAAATMATFGMVVLVIANVVQGILSGLGEAGLNP